MSANTTTNENNDIVETIDGEPVPRIAEIQALPQLRLRVIWAEGKRSGRTDEVDLSPAIKSYKIYRPLRENDRLFQSARLIEDGDVVAWEGDDLEMTAEMIEELADQIMTPQHFAAFLSRNNLTQEVAAAELGRSRRQIGYYLSTGPIPRIVAWACRGYESDRLLKLAKEIAKQDIKYEISQQPELPKPTISLQSQNKAA
jgi:hypothetical protein